MAGEAKKTDNRTVAEKEKKFRKELFRIIEVGFVEDFIGRGYDIISLIVILLNLTVSILMTFEDFDQAYGESLRVIESVTVMFFLIDYIMRLYTADYKYPGHKRIVSVLLYMVSFNGIIDILSFLPYYMPIFFPSGAVAFRMFRVMRIFKLFRVNAYYDSLNVITEVLRKKASQLLSSTFIILLLMLASSLCMYGLEHTAQPDVFSNAFSGIWWSASTLLTVGYGDIYPVTTAGKAVGTVIAFLGVGMVAIPTGIISAGFVEEFANLRQIGSEGMEQDVHFIMLRVQKGDMWDGKMIRNLTIPRGLIIAAVQRSNEILVPGGDLELMGDDIVVMAAEAAGKEVDITLKEVELKEMHPWNGQKIRELDISRQTFIVLVRRKNRNIIPNGETVLNTGDTVIMYTKKKIRDAREIKL